ncbi:MAG: DNA polymerase III subunit chi [Burkholderiaceae bacterium]|nr:DNA polymerase III subunit chi [Burkholderiaceae bacterium]
MTRIDFHFNVTDKVHHVCRLVRKALHTSTDGQTRMLILADTPDLDRIDAALWQTAPSDFLAHCRSDAPAAVRARSPVILAPRADADLPPCDILVHLGCSGASVPAGFERFMRLFELVGRDQTDRAPARARWRHYSRRGYAISQVDLAAPQAGPSGQAGAPAGEST